MNKGKTWDSITTVKIKRRIPIYDKWLDTIMTAEIASISMRPDSSNIMFTNTIYGEVLISTDAGYNWRLADTLVSPTGLMQQGRIGEITKMAFNKYNPMNGYAVITYLDLDTTKSVVNGGLYKTTDGGYYWELAAFPDTSMWAVDVSQKDNEEAVFIGGYTEVHSIPFERRVPGHGIVRRSINEGKSWDAYDDDINWFNLTPTSCNNINSIFLTKNNFGFAVGDNGLIWRTADGVLWKEVSRFTSENLYSVQLIDSINGFIGGSNGATFKISNYFYFLPLNTITTKNISSIFFIDSLRGYAVGDDGLILLTDNAGTNWKMIEGNFQKKFNCIKFINNNTGFIVGDGGLIMKTNDSGKNWELIQSNIDDNLNSIYFIDDKNGFIVGNNGNILKTTDEGNSWFHSKIEVDGKYNNFNSIHVMDSLNGFIVGDNGIVLKSIVSGDTWLNQTFDVTKTFNDVWCQNKKVAFLAGNDRYLYKTKDSGTSWFYQTWCVPIRANVWSLRFWGDPGKEKLYMATEAGLFVLDEPFEQISDVIQNNKNMKNGRLSSYISTDGIIYIKYISQSIIPNTRLKLRIYDNLCRIVYEGDYADIKNEVFETEIQSLSLNRGIYIVLMFECDNIYYCKFAF